MIAACKAANVKLMIAYRCHYEPTNLKRRQAHPRRRTRPGAGHRKRLRLQHRQRTSGASTRSSPAAARSSTSASIPSTPAATSPARSLPTSPPTPPPSTTTAASTTVEENVAWTMRFPSGIVASCTTTYGANMGGYYRVYGSKGWLQVDQAFVYEGPAPPRRLSAHQARRTQPRPRSLPLPGRSRALLPLHPKQPPAAKSRRRRPHATCAYITRIYRSAGITILARQKRTHRAGGSRGLRPLNKAMGNNRLQPRAFRIP
jgi:predicted dehydrogenase